MILSCPNCATQYKVNDAVLGARGRTVRCTQCKTTWHAETPIDLRYSEQRDKDIDLVVEEEAKAPLHTVKAKKLPGKYRAMLEDKKRMRALAVEGMVWGGLAAVAVMTLTLAYFLRVDIVKAFPRIAGAYAMVGLKVNPTHLEFQSHTGQVAFKGGRFVVTVKAQIKNLSDKAVPVPPVRVTLLDSTLQPFDSVLMPAGGLVVEPHATRTLTFDVADPRNMVSSLDLKFDIEAMKKGQSGKATGHGNSEEHGNSEDHSGGEDHGAPAHDAPHETEAPHAGAESDPHLPAVTQAGAEHAEDHGVPAATEAPDHESGGDAATPDAPISTHQAPPLRSAVPASAHGAKPSAAHGGH